MEKNVFVITPEALVSQEALVAFLEANSLEDIATGILLIVADNNEVVTGLKNEMKVLDGVNVELQKQVTVLSEKPTVKAETAKPEAPVVHTGKSFTHAASGKVYEFNWPKQTINKVAITCDMVIADAALQEELVASNSPMIKEKA